jgi:hypothetical protein
LHINVLFTDLFKLSVLPNHDENTKKAYCILRPGKVMWNKALSVGDGIY